MLVDRLRNIRMHLHAAEAAQPNCPHLQALHEDARRLLYWAKRRGLVDGAIVMELDEPPAAGGTPKTDVPDEGDGG